MMATALSSIEKEEGGQMEQPRIDPHAARPVSLPRFAEAMQKLIYQQKNVLMELGNTSELREDLRRKRDEKGDLEAELMKAFRARIKQGAQTTIRQTGDDTLDNTFDAYEAVTDEYRALEESYNQAEQQLRLHAEQLAKSMERFVVHYAKQTSGIDLEVYCSSEPPVSNIFDDDNSSLSSAPRDRPALLREFLSRVGDFRILQEQLMELYEHQAWVLNKQEQTDAFGMPLDEESCDFLTSFDDEWMETSENLAHAQQDVAALESICFENKLLEDDRDALDHVYQFGVASEPSLIFHGQSSDHHVAAALPLPPKTISDDGELSFSEDACGGPEAPKLDKATFINIWIWNQLRISNVEVHRLEACYMEYDILEGATGDSAPWDLAQRVWFEDKPPTSNKSVTEVGSSTIGAGRSAQDNESRASAPIVAGDEQCSDGDM